MIEKDTKFQASIQILKPRVKGNKILQKAPNYMLALSVSL